MQAFADIVGQTTQVEDTC